MDESDIWQATHRDLSEIDLKFRQMAKDSPEFLDRATFRALDRTNDLLEGGLQPWLTFIGPRKLEEFKRASIGISQLILDAPRRVFREDWAGLASFLHLGSPTIAEVLFLEPTGVESFLMRGDFIETANGFKCIELNCTPNLGGWDIGILFRRHLTVPCTNRFLEQEGIQPRFTDTILEMFLHILEDVRRKDIARDGEVTIAFEAGDEKRRDEATVHFQKELDRTIATAGLDVAGRVVFARYEELVVQNRNTLTFNGRRVDAVVELQQIQTPPPLYRLFKAGRVALYNGPLGIALTDKRNLALLSTAASSGAYSPEERAFIEAHLPWTRLVVPGETEYEGTTRPLADLLRARQERFVLKLGDSKGGVGVYLGQATTPEEWSRRVDTALAEGTWVVQEIQESRPYLYQSGDYGCSLHHMVWGPFLFGTRFSGVVLRMQPKAMQGPINLGLRATEGVVLEV